MPGWKLPEFQVEVRAMREDERVRLASALTKRQEGSQRRRPLRARWIV